MQGPVQALVAREDGWVARAPGLLPEKTDAGSGSYLSHLLAS